MTHETLQAATLNNEGSSVESDAESPRLIRGSASGLMLRKAEDFATIVLMKQASYGDPLVTREYDRLSGDIAAAVMNGELVIGELDDERTIDVRVLDFINQTIEARIVQGSDQTLRDTIADQNATIQSLRAKLNSKLLTMPAPILIERNPLVPIGERISLRQRFIALGATDEDLLEYDRVADFETAVERDAYLESDVTENTGSRFIKIVSTLSEKALGLIGIAPHSAAIETVIQK